MRALAPGTLVGPYRVESLLGQGGMGAVYRAHDERLGRTVALKVIAAAADAEALARFRREARALGALNHPHVIRVHEASWEGARAYMALELAAGGTLSERIKRDGRLTWREVARVGAQVARGLAAVHALGIVHRDLKPANIFFDESGNAKVGDLGLVRASGPIQSQRLTATGELLGTPGYLSPEQVDGARDVGAASDLFSLGATLFHALAGRQPFEGTGPALLFQVLSGTPARLRDRAPDVPPALERLVLSLLEKDPRSRPASAAAVAATLEAIGAADRAARSLPWTLAPFVPVAAAVALALAIHGGSREPVPAPSATTVVPRRTPGGPPSATPSPQGERPAPVWHRGDGAWSHALAIHAIALAPDESWLVSSGYDATVHFWDTTTGKPRATVRDLEILSFAISADGQRVFGGTRSGLVVLDGNGILLRRFEGIDGDADQLALEPSEKAVFVGTAINYSSPTRGAVRRLDLETGKVETLREGRIVTALLASEGEVLVGERDGAVLRLANGATAPVPELSAASFACCALARSPDGRLLAAHDGLKALELVRWKPGAATSERQDADPGNAVAFTPDGREAIITRRDGSTTIRDLETKVERRFRVGLDNDFSGTVARSRKLAFSYFSTVIVPFRDGTPDPIGPGHRGSVSSLVADWARGEVITGAADGVVQILRIEDGKTVTALPPERGAIGALALDPVTRDLAFARWSNMGGALLEWDRKGPPRPACAARDSLGGDIWNDLVFTPAGRLVGGKRSGLVATLDHGDRTGPALLRIVNGVGEHTFRLPDGDGGAVVYKLAVAPDGERVVSAGLGLRAWDVEKPGDGSPAWSASLSPTNNIVLLATARPRGEEPLLLAGEESSGVLHAVTFAAREDTVISRGPSLTALAADADGPLAAIARLDGSIELRDLSSEATLVATLHAPEADTARSLALDSRAGRLLVGTARGTVLCYAIPKSGR